MLDTGKVRNGGDVLSINGYTYANSLSAAARNLIIIEMLKTVDKGYHVSHSRIVKFVGENPELYEIIKAFANKNKKFPMLSISAICSVYFIISKKNAIQAESFIEKYYTGLDLSINEPVYLLREKLIRDSVQKSKLNMYDKMSFVIVAWNHFRKGKLVKKLEIGDTFPKSI